MPKREVKTYKTVIDSYTQAVSVQTLKPRLFKFKKKIAIARRKRFFPVSVAKKQTLDKDIVVSFGTATASGPAPDPEVVARYACESNQGLARALKALAQPGVVLDIPSGVPLFQVSPDDPDLIVREIDGVRETGTFKDGKFEKSPSA